MSIEKQDSHDLLSLLHEQGTNDHVASLRYAQMIQSALMPNPAILKGKHFRRGRKCVLLQVIVPAMEFQVLL
jgi:fermentation-respiration switch protein FrsA (DUF1100 family)